MPASVRRSRPHPHRQPLPICPCRIPIRCGTMFHVADLLERQVELQLLEAAVGRAEGGSGTTVLVLGEAGIGKTSLLRAFLGELDGRVRVLTGACEDLLTPRPLSPLQDAVAWSCPVRSRTRCRHRRTIPVRLLAAAAAELSTGPTVLVIEDAHWADGATLDVLRYLGRRMHELPAVLVISYRDDSLDLDHPLRSVLGGLASAEALRLHLGRLTPEAVARLAAREGEGRRPTVRADRRQSLLRQRGAGVPGLGGPTHHRRRGTGPVRGARARRTGRSAADLRGPVGYGPRRTAAAARGPRAGRRGRACGCARVAWPPGVLPARAGAPRGGVVVDEHPAAGAQPRDARGCCSNARTEAKATSFRILHHAVEAGDHASVVSHGIKAARQATQVGAHRQAAVAYEQVLARGDLLDATRRGAPPGGLRLGAEQHQPARCRGRRGCSRAVERVTSRPASSRAWSAPLVTLSRQQWLTERTADARASAERALQR